MNKDIGMYRVAFGLAFLIIALFVPANSAKAEGDWKLSGEARKFSLIDTEPAAVSSQAPDKFIQPKPYRMVVITAGNWCDPCKDLQAGIATLPSSGWSAGFTPDNHIQIINVENNPTAQQAWKAYQLPTAILLDHEREVARMTSSDHIELCKWFNAYVAKANKPAAAQPTEERRVLALFTDRLRVPACSQEDSQLAILRGAGWKAGETGDQHILMLEQRNHTEAFKKYDIEQLPTWILLVNGKEAMRYEGYLNAAQIGKMYKAKLTDKEPDLLGRPFDMWIKPADKR